MELGNPRTIPQLRALLTLMREMGVTHIKDGDLELRLGPVPLQGEEIQHNDSVGEDPAEVMKDPMADIPLKYRGAFGITNG